MANRDIVAVGTSAGGFEALRFLASELPPDFAAAVLIVIHLTNQFKSQLDAILTQAGPLPATFAEDGQAIERGRIYIAPPERHLLVDGTHLSLGVGPRENYSRPSIDPLFRSAALCCGGRAVGVVLTGTLGDGASGLVALKRSGGVTVVQDPDDAAFREMPAVALTRVQPDHIATLASMPSLLVDLVAQEAGTPVPLPEDLKFEVQIARNGRSSMSTMDNLGRRSVLTCPDCQGVMWEIDDKELVRFRCHVGHAYTAELMSMALDENLTRALGSALRALDERIALAHKLQKQAENAARKPTADGWKRRAEELEREAQVIRDSIRRFDEIGARAAREGV